MRPLLTVCFTIRLACAGACVVFAQGSLAAKEETSLGSTLTKVQSLNQAVSGKMNLKKDGETAQIFRVSGLVERSRFKLNGEVKLNVDQGKEKSRDYTGLVGAECRMAGFFLAPQVEYNDENITATFKAGYRNPHFEGFLGYEAEEETADFEESGITYAKISEEFSVGATYSF